MIVEPSSIHRALAPLLQPNQITQRHALTVLCCAVAVMAFVSLNPYFLWAHQKQGYALATLAVIAALPFCWKMLSFSGTRIRLMLGFGLFLVYLSLLPKIGGGHTRWFLLIPFTVSLLALRRTELEKAFGIFYWLFSMSLVPGILLWIWAAAGLPIEFTWMTPPSEIVQRGVIEYFMAPGAVVLPANAMMLPNGGIVFRLCGIYDEPGTVGTIAALLLAADRFRLNHFRGLITFVAGLMSFSIAFAILCLVGLAATAIIRRQWILVLAAILAAGMGGVVSGLIPLNHSVEGKPKITVTYKQAGKPTGEIRSGSELEYYGLDENTRLRFSSVINNRAMPKMRELIQNYWQAPAAVLMFGVASDASNQTGGSSVWYMILTNYGIIGFVWLFFLFFIPIVLLWRSAGFVPSAALFCALFLMSFYQRPVIWLPAQLLIYIAGIFLYEKFIARERPNFVAPRY